MLKTNMSNKKGMVKRKVKAKIYAVELRSDRGKNILTKQRFSTYKKANDWAVWNFNRSDMSKIMIVEL